MYLDRQLDQAEQGVSSASSVAQRMQKDGVQLWLLDVFSSGVCVWLLGRSCFPSCGAVSCDVQEERWAP